MGWTHARYANFNDGVANTVIPGGGILQTGGQNFSGHLLTYVPDITAQMGVNYSIPAFTGKLTFDANYYYNGGFYPESEIVPMILAFRRSAQEQVIGSGDQVTGRRWQGNL